VRIRRTVEIVKVDGLRPGPPAAAGPGCAGIFVNACGGRGEPAAPDFRERAEGAKAGEPAAPDQLNACGGKGGSPSAVTRRRRVHEHGRSPFTASPEGSLAQAEGLFTPPPPQARERNRAKPVHLLPEGFTTAGRRPVHPPPPKAVHFHVFARPQARRSPFTVSIARLYRRTPRQFLRIGLRLGSPPDGLRGSRPRTLAYLSAKVTPKLRSEPSVPSQ
jgi:hypothetical protein